MATDKPRINFAMEPRLYEALRRVAAARGKPIASIVRGFLEPSVEALERVADTLERVKELEQQPLAELAQAKAEAVEMLKSILPPGDDQQISIFDVEGVSGEDAPTGPTGPLGAPAAARPSSSGRKKRGGRG